MSVADRLRVTRVTLSASALVGTALLWLAIAPLHPRYGWAVATLVAGAAIWWYRGVFSRRRVVLWLEERVPTLRFSLAALEDAPSSPFRPALEQAVASATFQRPVAIGALRLIGIPLALLLATQFAVRPLVERIAANRTAPSPEGASDGPKTPSGSGRLVATVTPPSYAGERARTFTNPSSVAALVGSALRFSGDWSEATTMPARPVALKLDGPRGVRIVALEPRQDSTPAVVLELPARDSVIATPSGGLRLAAQARDDIGLVDGWFELIVSSGSGESFTFRSTTLGRRGGKGARTLSLAASLPLDSLQLKPGDVLHLRAVARDANPAANAEAGSSVTRTFRIPRAGENDSLSVTPAPPPEVGQSELSQRMLIILTERLVARERQLSRDVARRESGTIAREQGKLRKRVGEILFSRLTGEEHDDDDLDDVMADTISPAEALLKAADAATDIEIGHSHGDEGPIVNVNRPLLEAFNAMWEAERELGVGAPRAALPHMRAALEAIQRARAAERIYLRGRPPKVVIDEARIRLAGKRDEMSLSARSPRASALRELLARRARFDAALELLNADAAERSESADMVRAAIDSLMVLRIDVIQDSPQLSQSLEKAIEDLRSSRDATNSLLLARRALIGAPLKRRHTGWGGIF